MNESRCIVAKLLLKEGLVMFGEFQLRRHHEDPTLPPAKFYIDLRPVESLITLRELVVDLLRRKMEEEELFTDYVADVPTAFTPEVAILSYLTGIPMISPRREKKTYGTGRSINGKFEKGKRVLLIDDLITDAGSKILAIQALEAEGLIVEGVLVLIDREEGGREMLEKWGYRFHSVFAWSELLRFYAEEGLLTIQQYMEFIHHSPQSS